MALTNPVRKNLLRTFLLTLASLFLIPLGTLVFGHYVLHKRDVGFMERVHAHVDEDARMAPEQRQEALAWYASHPLSSACDDLDPQDRQFHDQACETYAMPWQFHWAVRAAVAALVLGVALLASALALAALAFVNRGLQYASFVAGWCLLTVASAVEVVLQGAMVLWLSFWLTAYFFERYSVKLVAIAGVAAALAAFYAVVMLFRRSPLVNHVDGEPVTPAEAPLLWEAVRAAAGRVKTAPPDHIVAGIDVNFFVTETPCVVGDRTLTGRTLFISLPLLRVLDRQEADAVLAHELAHLGGGDTRSGARLGPKLRQFDEYAQKMYGGGLTRVVFYLLYLYRMIFEVALARDSREREFIADRVAAGLTAPRAIAQSLVKISAYARYRDEVERRLFDQDRQHDGALSISSFVADGLQPYAASPDFVDGMRSAAVPHPYDSHPPLRERMRQVGHEIDERQYGAIVTATPQGSWVDDIPVAAAIETRLWAAYERVFSERHLHSLAYRYEPANEEELAIVLRFFPPVAFDLGKGRRIVVSHDLLRAEGDEPRALAWDHVKAMTFKDGSFGGKTLVVGVRDPATGKNHDAKIKLRGLGKQEVTLKAALGTYWQRHQVMRAQQA